MITDKFAIPSFNVQIGTDFDGDITAVGIVNQIFKRKDNFISCLLICCGIVVVIDCDKTDSESRENFLNMKIKGSAAPGIKIDSASRLGQSGVR